MTTGEMNIILQPGHQTPVRPQARLAALVSIPASAIPKTEPKSYTPNNCSLMINGYLMNCYSTKVSSTNYYPQKGSYL